MKISHQFDASSMPRRCFDARLPHFVGSLRRRERHSGDSHDIARGHGEFEVLIDSLQTSIHRLPDAAHRLASTEVHLDPLANHLAQSVAVMPRGAAVDGTAAAPGAVLRHVRNDVTLPRPPPPRNQRCRTPCPPPRWFGCRARYPTSPAPPCVHPFRMGLTARPERFSIRTCP